MVSLASQFEDTISQVVAALVAASAHFSKWAWGQHWDPNPGGAVLGDFVPWGYPPHGNEKRIFREWHRCGLYQLGCQESGIVAVLSHQPDEQEAGLHSAWLISCRP